VKGGLVAFLLELMVWQPGDELLPVEEYLRRPELHPAEWPYPEEAIFLLEVDGTRYLADVWSFGEVRELVPQLRAAAERLRQGRTALVRSGVLDDVGGAYLVFEPAGDQARLSLFTMVDPDWEFVFPVDRSGATNEDLYRYIQEHRDLLLAAPRASFDPYLLPVPTQPLIEALERAASAGQRLGELTGWSSLD
jgi:hypothetical protein